MHASLHRNRLPWLVAAILVLLLLALWAAGSPAPVAAELCGNHTGIECRSGVIRVETPDAPNRALDISALLPPGPSTVVLAGRSSGELAVGAGLATAFGGPLLVMPAAGLPGELDAELLRLAPERIILVGRDPAAVRLADFIAATGPNPRADEVILIGGPDAPTISAEAAGLFERRVPVAYVVGDHDSRPMINVAMLLAKEPGPVIVTHYGSVPEAVARALSRLAPQRLVVVGGSTGFTTRVEQQLIRYAGAGRPLQVTRIETHPRETGVAIARTDLTPVREAYLVSMHDAVGAFATAAVAHRSGGPILATGFELTRPVTEVIDLLDPESVIIVGGAATVGRQTDDEVGDTLRR